MSKSRRVTRTSLVVCFMVFLIFLGVSGTSFSKAKYVMKIGHVLGADHSYMAGLTVFEKLVEERTSGAVDVQLFPNGQLGNERDVYEGLKLGTIEGMVGLSATLTTFVPEVAIFSFPYIFRNWEHVYAVVDGPLGDELRAKATAKGIRILGWWQCGIRDVYHNVRPINSIDDIRGLKIRVMEDPVYLEVFKSFGAVTVPMPWGEVYTALQQGVIDGCESTIQAAWSVKHHEVAKYVCRTNDVFSISPFSVSEAFWSRLPKDIQEVMIQAEKEARAIQRKADRDADKVIEQMWKDYGRTVTHPDLEPFRRLARGVYPKFAKTVGQENIDLIIKVGEMLAQGRSTAEIMEYQKSVKGVR